MKSPPMAWHTFKKSVSVFRLLLVICLCLGCSSADLPQSQASAQAKDHKKVLILYLSRTQNTKALAEMIHQQLGGKLVPIELETPYPENYQAIVQQVQQENERGYLPPLRTKIDDLESYDIVFLGFPTWGMQLPPPVKSFLQAHPLAGVTLIPFNTHAGYGVGSSFETIETLCPDADMREGFSVQGGIERDGIYLAITGERAKTVNERISKWLQKVYRPSTTEK